MSFSKIFLPTITSAGLIAGSIITISNLSSSKKSDIQSTQLEKNDTSTNNIENEENIKKEVEELFEKVEKDFYDLFNKVKKTSLNGNIWEKYLKILNESDKTFKIPTSSNLEKLKEMYKQIQEVSDLLKELNHKEITI